MGITQALGADRADASRAVCSSHSQESGISWSWYRIMYCCISGQGLHTRTRKHKTESGPRLRNNPYHNIMGKLFDLGPSEK